MEQVETPMVFYRGGTSKAIFVEQRDVPIGDEKDLAAWILAIYGSPDLRQIDGLGGADPLTSKFAVLGPPTRNDADIDYTFYQVSIAQAMVSKDMNCGNISSAIGPYAVEQGYAKATGDSTTVRVHATNFGRIIKVTVETQDGKPKVLGPQQISGVPGTGAPIHVDFSETIGTHGMGLLPTGNPRDRIEVEGIGEFEVSVLDIANLIAFAKASDFGLSGTESPVELSGNKDLMEKFEKLRRTVGVKLGLAKDLDDAAVKCSLSPFLGIVAEPKDWKEFENGKEHKASECDFLACSTLAGQVHKAYMASGSVCTGIAAILPGTIVNEMCKDKKREGTIRIGHPSGTLDVEVEVEQGNDGYTSKRAVLVRTARRLMQGTVLAAVNRLPWITQPPEETGNLVVDRPGPSQQFRNEIFHAN